MVDPMDIELKFKKGGRGEHICYSKSCPEVVGKGQDDDQAATNFWKEFDLWCEKKETTRPHFPAKSAS